MADAAPTVAEAKATVEAAKVLPNTPDWSPSRIFTIRSSSLFGMAALAVGAAGSLWHMTETIAALLISNGASIVIASMTIHIGGASAERIGGWFSTGKKETPP